MGQFFQQEDFNTEQYQEFVSRLYQQLDDLKSLLDDSKLEQGDTSIGAELELYLVDRAFNPRMINQQILEIANNPQLTEELNRYNMEFNLSPVMAQGKPFTTMDKELRGTLDSVQSIADGLNSQVMAIGILPTLQHKDLERHCMTDLPRYRVLTKAISDLRGEAFHININGDESLQTYCDEVTLEGANTSFQLHLRVPQSRFKNMYNAAQLVTPLLVAISANSPLFMDKKLWHETRIALFKQSIDSRVDHHNSHWKNPPRVHFGNGWVREGVWELFAENVALYPPIIPLLSEDNAFAELSMHHGTVWNWNRAVFDSGKDQHLRIEFRALPAGPTVTDMMANAALAIGLTQALADDVDGFISKLPFTYAEYNFYRAAQYGLNARILWPQPKQQALQEVSIVDVIQALLPLAAQGLAQLHVEPGEIDHLMSVIEERLAHKQTGAIWQLNKVAEHEKTHSRRDSLNLMLSQYLQNMIEGEPVSKWK
ncbi:hypothetical protein KIH87_13470 [Paraneptunicella aestuarii]|uniref:glutamate--cysteine ligase n=1 Tax=Paraneptunicella aestuarii TaxID=2831148 RepID=UPI001E5ACE9B|nr:glutamate--cysteine ligase [Paraneptunicella aestuarii]UAA37712.1 hypothetical protein KIH87_13470 [Paraneptunicella aestuarii]